jgi:hypothetical protein
VPRVNFACIFSTTKFKVPEDAIELIPLEITYEYSDKQNVKSNQSSKSPGESHINS